MNEIVNYESPGPPGRRPERLRMDSIPAARRTLERFIRSYYAGHLDDSMYKGLVYGMSHLLAYLRAEQEGRIEERLDELERMMKGGPNANRNTEPQA